MSEYDAVVIGAGAGGGIVAALLAEAGKTVLLLERGPDLSYSQVSTDHLRNQRTAFHGHNAGPAVEGNPRVSVQADGSTRIVRPHEGAYHNIAAIVGGGTRVYGGQAWRFMPEDFRMASVYGVPAGSSLADWPISYDDLEPAYDRAEWEIGVAGDASQHTIGGPRRRPLPMPAAAFTLQSRILKRGADRLGIATQPVPYLINTIPRDGRAACVECGLCPGYACPVEAKNGTHNTVIPRAVATGRCVLVAGAQVERICVDAHGKANGVWYFGADGERRKVSSRIVVCSAGAVESARLLLNSATAEFPAGLGNRSDQVGRHLQGHYYHGICAILPEQTYDGLGPGASLATLEWAHHNPGIIGGAMLCNEFIKTPIAYLKGSWRPGVPRWGIAAKRWMRETYQRAIQVQGPVNVIPMADGRVTVDRSVRDRFGIPVARFSGTNHIETVRAAKFIVARTRDWLAASGATEMWGDACDQPYLSGGSHSTGTCRMGDEPKTSVCDSFGGVHGHENLFVIDGSLHVTNGSFNPALTIMALAYRCGEHIAQMA